MSVVCSLLFAQNYKVIYDNSGNVVKRAFILAESLADSSKLIIKQDDSALKIDVSPNPTKGLLNVVSNVSLEEYPLEISVFSTSAKTVFSQKFNEPSFRIDISHLGKGVYVLVAKTAKRESKVKLIIE